MSINYIKGAHGLRHRKNTNKISGNKDSEEITYSKGEHPNSLANLKPFPKGISGNPLGRPTKFESLKEH